MAERFRRDDDPGNGSGARTATGTRTDHDRETGRTTVRERDDRRAERPEGTVGEGTMAAVRRRQRDEFGGFAWGSAFFGWLTALGLGALLTALLAAAGAVLAISTTAENAAGEETIGIGAGIAFLVVMAISYFAGGYVAGRMARFDGARQGVAVVLWAILVAIILALVGVIGGSEYNVLSRLDLPRIPIDEGSLATGGVIALVVSLLVMFVSAILGGKVGERFHRKVDRHVIDGR